MRRILGLLLGLSFVASAVAQPQVAPTEPLAPEDEARKFHLPPGFVAELVAAEPAIQKPINLAFDARGRLLVAHSIEYPFAAKGEGRDAITRFEDRDGDGRYESSQVVVDKLNIPIGLLPYRDGLIIYTIAQILDCRDADGGGQYESRRVLFEGFGSDDTHGMNNAFRRALDGWIHVAHGFRNASQIRGTADTARLSLTSGNTYRILADGSRIEQFTFGQVNPFGLCFDPWGNLYSADCHSRPAYLLLRGAYYPSFGKPHDGMGFGPELLTHAHGSTGISGVVFYDAEQFPAAYRHTLFLGNPVTSRINHDRMQPRGSGYRAIEQPDFLRSDDPWFRPVDLQLGPDGALYVADFYNRIIGHYEVPLTHPQRDRHRGRIWRIVYRGESSQPLAPPRDLTRASADELWQSLADANLTVRTAATHELVDRFAATAGDLAGQRIAASQSAPQRAHAVWVLARTGRLDRAHSEALARDPDPLVRVHLARALAGSLGDGPAPKPADDAPRRRLLQQLLADDDAIVRRAAADSAGQRPHYEFVALLLARLADTPEDDVYLRHTLRLALRSQLSASETFPAGWAAKLSAAESQALADVAAGVQSEAAASLIVGHVIRFGASGESLARLVQHAVANVPAADVDGFIRLVRDKGERDASTQLRVLESLVAGLQRRGVAPSADLRAWGGEIVSRVLSNAPTVDLPWHATTLDGQPTVARWGLEERKSADGQSGLFLSSLPGGEELRGKLKSRPFAVPAKLRFFVCGHLGVPGAAPQNKNVVRLRAVRDDTVLAEALPPRNDVAQPVEWNLAKHAGEQAYLELVDDLDSKGYAWLAVARFDPPVVPLVDPSGNSLAQQKLAALGLVASLQLAGARGAAAALVGSPDQDVALRSGAAKALVALAPHDRRRALAELIDKPQTTAPLRESACRAIAASDESATEKTLVEAMRTAPTALQTAMARSLTGSASGTEVLLALVEQGHAAPRLLQLPELRQKVLAASPAAEERLTKLTKGLPSAAAEIDKLIDARRAGFAKASRDVAAGQAVFKKTCAACHKIGAEGHKVGPELDGIGQRGLDRLLEDVLDPSRNLDPAFFSTTLVTKQGRVLSGLLQREEGALLILVDAKGEPQRVAKSDVDEQNRSRLSPMPANVAEVVSEADFYHLVAFLLEQRAAASAEKPR